MLIVVTQDCFYDLSDQEIVCVWVSILTTRFKICRLIKNNAQYVCFIWSGIKPWVIDNLVVVRNSAAMLHQHCQCNLVRIFYSPIKIRQITRQCAIEIERWPICKFSHHRCDIEFGDACNLEKILRVGGRSGNTIVPTAHICLRGQTTLTDIDNYTINTQAGEIVKLGLHSVRQRCKI